MWSLYIRMRVLIWRNCRSVRIQSHSVRWLLNQSAAAKHCVHLQSSPTGRTRQDNEHAAKQDGAKQEVNGVLPNPLNKIWLVHGLRIIACEKCLPERLTAADAGSPSDLPKS